MDLARRTAVGALALLLLTGFPSVQARGDFDTTRKALAGARKGTDETAICRAIHALAAIANSKVDRELRSVLTKDRRDRVCAEAARALGTRKGRGTLSTFKRVLKTHRKRPRVIEGVIEGIAAFEEPRTVDLLYDQARHFLQRDSRVTLAVIQALGSIRSKEAVERLIDILGLSEPRVGYGARGGDIDGTGGAVPGFTSDETIAKLSEYQPYVARSLRRLTGETLEGIGDWQEWWREVRKTWRLPARGDDLNIQLVLRSIRYRFEIRRPTGQWKWIAEPEKGFHLTAERQEDGKRVAWVSVHMHSRYQERPGSVDEMLVAQKAALMTLLAVKSDSTWDETAEIGGVTARLQRVAGTLGGGFAKLEQAVLEKEDRLYLLRWVVRAEAGFEAQEEMKAFVESFRLLD